MGLEASVVTGLAIVRYKLVGRCTRGDLHEEIIKNRSAAAVIIGVCLIVGGAIIG